MFEGRKETERESSGQAFIILKFAKMTLVGGKKRSVAFQELLRTVSFKCAPHPEQPMEAPLHLVLHFSDRGFDDH